MTQSKAIIDSVVESEEESTRHVSPDGTVKWRNKDCKLHRRDGPAVEHPAREWSQGFDEWWVDGKLHRIDGPAVESMNGHGEWWVNGVQFTEDEFYRYVDHLTGEVLVPPGKKLAHDYDE